MKTRKQERDERYSAQRHIGAFHAAKGWKMRISGAHLTAKVWGKVAEKGRVLEILSFDEARRIY